MAASVDDATVEVGKSCIAVRWHRPRRAEGATSIVLLHEALGCIALWKGFGSLLAETTGRQVLAYDRIGHGQSTPLSEARGLDYLHRLALEELPAVLEACGVNTPVLMGHSDGATIATLYAAHQPTAAVIVESIHVLVEDRTVDGVRNAVTDRQRLVEKLRRYRGMKSEALVAAWADTWCASWFRGWNVVDELGTIRCPLLAIQGLHDSYGTVRQVEELRRGIGAPVTELLLKGCGHAPHREAPEQVLEAVRVFLLTVP